MKKILLSTYLLKIYDNEKNEQVLSNFNGSEDFLNIFEDYLNQIFENIRDESDNAQTVKLHLTLDSPPKVDAEKRVIYGYFSSGVSGDQYQIRDVDTQSSLLDVESNHAAFRNLFFYIKVPVGKKSGTLILQRRAKYGIKTIFRRTVNRYMREEGYDQYRVEVNNILHGRVYQKMIQYGNLKKIELIKRQIPATLEEYYESDGNPELIPGTLKTTMASKTSLPSAYRRIVGNLFNRANVENQRIELIGIDEEFDEVEFELELEGKKKKFYVANKSRIQPDIDVTDLLDYDDNNQPTFDSLLNQCEELVDEIINLNPVNV